MDLAYKLIVIGDSGVGKSNITMRFCDDKFFEDGVATLGIDFKYTTCRLISDHEDSEQPESVRLQVWDTAGHDRFATLTAGFYRSCQGIMLCFDLTNRGSFARLDVWYSRVRENIERLPPLILVGCKLDLVQDMSLHTPNPQTMPGTTGLMLRGDNYGFRQVDTAEAEAWAREHGALCYIETSAKENTNVRRAFEVLATCVARESTSLPPTSGGDKIPPRMVRTAPSLDKPSKSGCPC
jgi:Rab family, other